MNRVMGWIVAGGALCCACAAEAEPEIASTPLEEQLATLAALGLVPEPSVVPDDFLLFDSRAQLEARPYEGVVQALGYDVEREPFTPACDRVWMCDLERIEDEGDYVAVVERLERMSDRALGLESVRDHVDLEAGEAWVELERGGQTARWDLAVDDDWLDPDVLLRYDALLAESGSPLRLWANSDFGQSLLLIALTPEDRTRFAELSPMVLAPLLGG
jgi:hypothetical protein